MLRFLFLLFVVGFCLAVIGLAGLIIIPTVIAAFGIIAGVIAAIVTFIFVVVFLCLLL